MTNPNAPMPKATEDEPVGAAQRAPDESLDDILERMTPENAPELVFPDDQPRGREIW